MLRPGNRDRRPLQALKRLVDITTLISPTQNGFHKSTVVTCDKVASEQGNVVMTPVMDRHFRTLYDDLRGKDSLLSQVKLAAFLERTQEEETLKPLEKEEYRFEEFLEIWWYQYGLEAVKPPGAAEKDLTKPISNYFISSSHNTYLDGDQYFSNSCADMYRKVLKNDCRCIEIDVWNGDLSEPRTPNRSRSPHGDHRRHIPSSASVREAVEEGLETVKHIISGKEQHSRSNSSSQNPLPTNPARGSSASLDPNAIGEKLDRPPSSRSRDSCPKHEPVVMHATPLLGRQATVNRSVVGFREVCRAVRETAFESNPLPIIVSLEVHANPEQQEVMVEIMKEEWAGLLLEEPIEGCDPNFRQPRLEELPRKILIKVRRAVSTSASNGLAPVPTIDDEGSGSEDEHAARSKVKICDSLGKLAIYTHGATFKNFDVAVSKTPGHVFSLAETRILNLHVNKATHEGLFAHNRDYLMRAYPDPTTHVLSTNLDPSLFWRKGAQMVALNWQTLDEGMMLNTGMFLDQRGWVLKPPGYRSSDVGSALQAAALRHRTLTLAITVLAGQHLPLPKIREDNNGPIRTGIGDLLEKSFHPYVKCELHVEKPEERSGDAIEGGGHAREAKEGQHKQKTTSRRTKHPDFGMRGVTLLFERIEKVVEELSFVRFKVEDENKPLGGGSLSSSLFFSSWACIRLDRLRTGYRFINLYDSKGDLSDGRLLVKIEKTFH